VTGRLLLAAVLLLIALASLASPSLAQEGTTRTDAGTGSRRAPRPPSELWQQFPLGERTTPQGRTTQATFPPPALVAADDSSKDERLLLLVGIGASGVLVTAMVALVLMRRRQGRFVAESREGLLAILAEPRIREQKIGGAHIYASAVGCDMVITNRPRARGTQVSDESESTLTEQEAAAGSPDYTALGDRVAAVLQAAEEASSQMRNEAQVAAEQMTRLAEQDAKSLLEDATAEAQKVRLEADTEARNTREAVETYATKHRREAEEKAAKLLSDAEGQARASREAAEAMARQIEERAQTLGEEVREQERVIRGRMQRYLAALRDVSGQIEDVLGETERPEPTLVEALDPERAKESAKS
jgi:cell division septum initiation protein DivIVA